MLQLSKHFVVSSSFTFIVYDNIAIAFTHSLVLELRNVKKYHYCSVFPPHGVRKIPGEIYATLC